MREGLEGTSRLDGRARWRDEVGSKGGVGLRRVWRSVGRIDRSTQVEGGLVEWG